MSPVAWLTIAATVVGLVTGMITFWLFIRPGVERRRASDDAILGVEPVMDRSGTGVIREGKPGLVHLQRENAASIAQLRETARETAAAMKTLAEVVAEQSTLRDLFQTHDSRLNVLEPTVKALVAASAERAATASAAAEAMKLVRDRELIDGESDEEEPR